MPNVHVVVISLRRKSKPYSNAYARTLGLSSIEGAGEGRPIELIGGLGPFSLELVGRRIALETCGGLRQGKAQHIEGEGGSLIPHFVYLSLLSQVLHPKSWSPSIRSGSLQGDLIASYASGR